MNAVDTNELIYAVDPRDPAKRAKALALLESMTDGVLLWQVALEYLAACRKLEPHGYSLAEGWENIHDHAARRDSRKLPSSATSSKRTLRRLLTPACSIVTP